MGVSACLGCAAHRWYYSSTQLIPAVYHARMLHCPDKSSHTCQAMAKGGEQKGQCTISNSRYVSLLEMVKCYCIWKLFGNMWERLGGTACIVLTTHEARTWILASSDVDQKICPAMVEACDV
jgi:hypothetical protein